MYKNLSEQREMLEEEAFFYLQELYHSEPFLRDENPNVYIRRGTLIGMCRVFDAHFEVELRRKITFYKGGFPGEGKFWFEVVNEYITEEEAKQRIEYFRKEAHKLAEMQSRF